MIVPAAVLAVAAIAIAFVPHLGHVVQHETIRFQDEAAYRAEVLHGIYVAHPVALHAPEATSVTPASVVTGLTSVIGSVLLAAAALYWRRLPVLRRGPGSGTGIPRLIDGFQSGVVNDYVAWAVLGLTCVGGALAFAVR